MPIHDWTRVEPGDFHHFHQGWTVEIGNALGGFFLRAHRHERESTRLAGELINDQFAAGDVAGLFEEVEHVAFGGVERQVSYE